MFESLSERLGGVFDRLTKAGALSEADVDTALREVRVALLEACLDADTALLQAVAALGYEGVVIAIRHGGLNRTITVRRIFQGIGVERVFMLHSPQVASIKVERRGKVRRAKLFYLRDRVGKATRVKQRFDR